MSLTSFQKGVLVGVIGGIVAGPWIMRLPGFNKIPTV
jgi:hypothetical protein